MKPCTLVKFDPCLPKGEENLYPFKDGEVREGKIIWGYHTEHFVDVDNDSFQIKLKTKLNRKR